MEHNHKTKKQFEVPVIDRATGETIYMTFARLREYVLDGKALPHEVSIYEELRALYEHPLLSSLFSHA